MNLGKRIKTIRKQNKITLQQISESTGLSQPFISEIEREIKSPSIETLSKICSALGITLGELFSLGEDITPLPPHLKELVENARDFTPEQIESLTQFLKNLKA